MLRRTSLVLALAAVGFGHLARAADCGSDGDFKCKIDTTLSYGALWRAEHPDPSLIGIANGGTARSVNGDNGNLNYGKGDLVSSLFKATEDVELKYRNIGFFLRATQYYDTQAHADRDNFGPVGRDRLVGRVQFLDAYFNGRFRWFGERSTGLRAGWQVLNWGESTFIPNGISVINPVDVSKLRAPGSELKEALLPSPILSVSQEINDSLSADAFVIAKFNRTRIDPYGSFFSTTDALSDDGSQVFVTFGRRKDEHFAPTNPSPAAALAAFGPFDPAASIWIGRAPDRRPSDKPDQYGFALHYLAEELNHTEFGFYALNYHSRTPLASVIKSNLPVATLGTGLCSIYSGTPAAATTGHNCSTQYLIEYPKDIHLYGLSFNTSLAGIAFQGEYSYRSNQPLQLAATDLVLAGLNLPSQSAADPKTIAPGSYIRGYERVHMHQVQLTATKAWPQVLGADQAVLVGEIGDTLLDLPKGLKFEGSGAGLPILPVYKTLSTSGGSIQETGFLTRNSLGYRLVGRADYLGVFGRYTVTPRISWSQDLHGVGPSFNQDTKALGLGVNVNLQQKLSVDLAYTNFLGGRKYCGTDVAALSAVPTIAGQQSLGYCTGANALRDRDFYAFTIGYSF